MNDTTNSMKRSRDLLTEEFTSVLDDAQELLEALRTLLRKLANEQGVPSFVIFHDSTLMQLVTQKPQTRVQLAQISGIGAQKLERYGAALLEVLQQNAIAKLEKA